MSGLRGEVQFHLRRYTETPYGREWLAAARRPGGIFRVRAGQNFPVVHIVFLQGLTTFIAPAPVMRAGHRTVNSLPSQFQSGKSLEEGELILSPQIRIELVTDPVLLSAARAGSHDVEETLVVHQSAQVDERPDCLAGRATGPDAGSIAGGGPAAHRYGP